MPQEPLEHESQLVSRSEAFNAGVRAVENDIDAVITIAIETVIDLPERTKDVNLRTMISVRMSLDEGLGYLGGQRLAHMRPYLLIPALDTYVNISWHALRELKLDRTAYRQGFREGFQDELNGTAQPLPPEPVFLP